ncbi:MAG TPA: hypothetical protein VJ890_01370 [Vineibacter sp.]|nr:hypothetical protein [Vineibacter sp.]
MTESIKALLQLAVIGVLGGLAKYIFDRLQAARLRWEAAIELQKELLRRLRAIQAQVGRARETLRADRSADNYRAQIRELMEARSSLSALSQELVVADEAMDGRGKPIAGELEQPVGFLSQIIHEWTEKNRIVQSMQQKGRDARDIADTLAAECPRLQELCDDRGVGTHRAEFTDRLESAARQLLQGIIEVSVQRTRNMRVVQPGRG